MTGSYNVRTVIELKVRGRPRIARLNNPLIGIILEIRLGCE